MVWRRKSSRASHLEGAPTFPPFCHQHTLPRLRDTRHDLPSPCTFLESSHLLSPPRTELGDAVSKMLPTELPSRSPSGHTDL
jgi:hypothetical protein